MVTEVHHLVVSMMRAAALAFFVGAGYADVSSCPRPCRTLTLPRGRNFAGTSPAGDGQARVTILAVRRGSSTETIGVPSTATRGCHSSSPTQARSVAETDVFCDVGRPLDYRS
jgi:hypothetical protein